MFCRGYWFLLFFLFEEKVLFVIRRGEIVYGGWGFGLFYNIVLV